MKDLRYNESIEELINTFKICILQFGDESLSSLDVGSGNAQFVVDFGSDVFAKALIYEDKLL